MSILKLTKKSFLIASAVSCLAISACTPTVAQRGNTLENYQVDEIVANVHTRSDVLRLLGSPTTQATFDENIWYYIGRTTEKHGIFDPEVVEERVVAVAFNEEGVVTYIGDIDGQKIDVPISDDSTPTHGNELTVMQQLLGNVGRFNPTSGKE
ncbi:MAG: outer membrane protein assembly factor BamE [Micavibrio sp.]|nr:MAG: outer membrane protein assembly factor BamE [Micavibrio sp.]